MLLLDRFPRLGGPSGAALRSGLRPSAQTQLPSAPLGGNLENSCDKGSTKLRQRHHIIGTTANTIVETAGTAWHKVNYGAKFLSNTEFELYNTGVAIGEHGDNSLISYVTIGNFLTMFLLNAISCERLPCFPGKTWRMGKFFSGEVSTPLIY